MPELPATSDQKYETACCIAGGGPAGMMLGFLLARAGVDVLVFEKHGDFLRDFRGDTIHPSTMEVMHELGLLEEFLKRPHQEMQKFEMQIGGQHITFADCSHLPVHCPFIAFMPQWDFLNFLLEHASRLSTFHLKMQAEVTDLIEQDGRVVGVRAKTANGNLEVRSALTVGADGRHSTVRRQAKLPVEDIGAPIDVLWMRISRHPDDPHQLLGRFDRGRALIMIDRNDYWQCGFLIRKGGYDELKSRGMPRFHEDLVAIAPFLRDRVNELADWDQIRLLTVAVDRLQSDLGSCASAMRRTPCRRWGASASTWRSRTPSRQPTCWRDLYARALLRRKISKWCSVVASCRRGSRNVCRSSCTGGSCTRFWPASSLFRSPGS
jgi:2-polyprenyl-6-methoxyphenol hydroxylase-like FAD-dependent oxidoreductase